MRSTKSWIKGEARFFRAYFLWDLFLKYGPVPMSRKCSTLMVTCSQVIAFVLR